MAASQMPLLLLALLALTASTSADETIYEILQRYGFPPGLLPDNVESYHTIPYFRLYVAYAVKLKSPCHVKYGSHDVYFDSEITLPFVWTGGRISGLKGVKLYGQNVTDIQVLGDRLYLGNPNGVVIFLDVKLFESIPTCEDAAGNPSSKLISQLPVTASTSTEPTIYEILQQYGFPPGLLPDNVESYHRVFSPLLYVAYAVKLKSPCHVKYGSHDVYFDSDITLWFVFTGGVVSVLNGVKLDGQNVTFIHVLGDRLHLGNPDGLDIFLDVKLFESIPTCEDAAGNPPSKLISQLPVTASTSTEPTIYEILQQYGFPPGLLPDNVESYHTIPYIQPYIAYDVKLKSPCHVKYGSIDVYFDSKISLPFLFTGGEIRGVNGVTLNGQNLMHIQVIGDRLHLVTANGIVMYLDIKLFESIPTCEDAAGNPSSKLISQLPVTAA